MPVSVADYILLELGWIRISLETLQIPKIFFGTALTDLGVGFFGTTLGRRLEHSGGKYGILGPSSCLWGLFLLKNGQICGF